MGNHKRFFVYPQNISGGIATITGQTARQMSQVLRMREGDAIVLLDGTGCRYDARITSITKSEIKAEITETRCCVNEPALKLTLAIGHPKGDKLELIVQKATELGISNIVVIDSERTVARPDSSKVKDRLARWQRIAMEAAEQSGRCRSPEVSGVLTYADLMTRLGDYDLAIVAWEDETGTTLKGLLREHKEAKSILLVVGPEGGLTEDEVESARRSGAKCASLGGRILRCETAAIAACAAIMYEIEGEL